MVMPVTPDLRDLFGIEHPIIQAPMAGSTTPELVAAVSNAGGLGSIGMWMMTPEQIREAIGKIRALTDRPFNVNLFAGGWESRDVDPGTTLDILRRVHKELGLSEPAVPAPFEVPFQAQIDAIIEARPPMFSFTFGMPDGATMKRLKEAGITTSGTATTVTEAKLLVDAGVDAVVAQGSEAGGHRGTFAGSIDDAMIGTMALVPQVVDEVSVPVIAAGGIMDGRGIVAAMALGARASQMGTAFLICDEASVPAVHRKVLRQSPGENVTITRAFSGRNARGIVNEFIDAWHGQEDRTLPFPLQNVATRDMRAAAATRDDPRYLALWAGQGAALAREPMPASRLMQELVQEIEVARASVTGR
jgi:nitronate monooxygenase